MKIKKKSFQQKKISHPLLSTQLNSIQTPTNERQIQRI